MGVGCGGEVAGKGLGGRIWCKKYIHMYVNVKKILVESVPGIRGEGMKDECRGVNSI
jgi:hypothetical protein